MDGKKIRNEQSVKDAEMAVINLLRDVKHAKWQKDYSLKLIENIFRYKVAELNLAEAEFKILTNKENYLGSLKDNLYCFNKNLLKPEYKKIVQLLDCVFHEFSHKETEIKNSRIKKDEFGNTSDKYLPKIREPLVFGALKCLTVLDVDTISDISIAFYAKNENEQLANSTALSETIKFLNLAKTDENSKLINKMIKFENFNYCKTKQELLTPAHIRTLADYEIYLKDTLIKFQANYVKEANKKNRQVLYEIARTLYPSPESDQLLFAHFLNLKDVNACIKIMNSPSFKNTPKNLKDLILLMKEKGLELSLLSGIEQRAIEKMAKVEDAENKPSGISAEDLKYNSLPTTHLEI